MKSEPVEADTGFVYVATGESYVAEAAVSASTLRRFHPDARVCIVTDKLRGEEFWDDVIILEQPYFGFRDKIQMYRAPYERCIFLDTDTAVCGDLSSLFTILTHFDVCGVHAEGQGYAMADGIPAAFPEMNSGMIGFRRCTAARDFFALWERFYDEFHALNRDGYYHSANVGDQKGLRAALWHSNVRHAVVGAEFNFVPFRLELVSLPVAVLHTRAREGLSNLAERLNVRLQRRAYVPSLDAVVQDGMTGRELWRLVLGTTRFVLRAVGRSLVLRTFRDSPPCEHPVRQMVRRSRLLSRLLFANYYEPPNSSGVPEAKWKFPGKMK